MFNLINKIKSIFSISAILLFVAFSMFIPSITSAASSFNSNSADYPLEVSESAGIWVRSLSGVNAGDTIRFSSHFHNGSTTVANNAKISLSLAPTTAATSFTGTATISADGFTNYVTSVPVSLTSSQTMTIRNTADFYHNYDGSNYTVTTLPVNISGGVASVSLGSILPGYAPNDGYVIFYADVSNITITPAVANANVDQTVTAGSTVQLNGSLSTGTSLSYSWTCTPAVTLSSTTIANPTFTMPASNVTCSLTVSNTSGTSTDSVNINLSAPISKVFNSSASDIPLEATVSAGSWVRSLSGVNAGDTIRFSSHFHNASTTNANNAKISLGLTPTTAGTSFTGTATISADGFTNYVTSVPVSLTSSQTMTIRNTADFYHNYDGSNYTVTALPVNISGGVASVSLGSILPGYAPNDGYVIFYADVSGSAVLPPVAKANVDQTVTAGSTVQLNGSLSTGTSLSYSWTCTPAVTLSSTTIANPTFTMPASNVTCSLTVSNTRGTSTDSVNINLSSGGGPVVVAPVANANVDQTVTAGSTVQLNGSLSTGTSLSYSWTCTPAVTLSSTTIANPTFTMPASNVTCSLTVSNTRGTSTDSVNINLSSGGGPVVVAPVANANVDQTVTAGSTVQLNGSLSTGTSLSYSWTCTPAVTLSSTTIANPTFTMPASNVTCSLTVSNTSGTSTDSVNINLSSGGGTVISTGGGGGPIIYYQGTLSAEILDVTENKNGSVTLNGKILACEKGDCTAKFSWGTKENSLTNSTNLITGLKSGEEFSYKLNNLEKGKVYYISLEAKMGTNTFKVESPLKFITTPDKPKSFTGTTSNGSVKLTWEMGEGGSKILIKKGFDTCGEFNDSNFPTIYFGEKLTATDTINSNQSYCYRAFMVSVDGLNLAYSEGADFLITKKEVSTSGESNVSIDNATITVNDNGTQIVFAPEYKLSLKSFARNSSLDNLTWEESINASPNDNVEVFIEIENIGSKSLYNLIILNTIREGLKDIKNVSINNISYPKKILDRAFIQELKAGESIKITFNGTVSDTEENKEITILTEAYSNQTKTITDVIKITEKNGLGGNGASIFETLLKANVYSWLILILIIIVLTLMYIFAKRRRRI